MDERRRGLSLLQSAPWGEDSTMIADWKAWQHFHLVEQALRDLQADALYKSAVHGSGHINRVILLAGLIAWGENLEERLFRQYLVAASYHDVGRYFDGLDLNHGLNSAQKIPGLTDFTGEALKEIQGAVAAHSQPDVRLEEMVALFSPKNMPRAIRLAKLLKDADNLDRVRLGDLKPDFIRHSSAKKLVDFSWRLFALDQGCKAACE